MPMVKWRLEPTVISRIQSQNVQSRKEPAVSLTDVTNFIFVNVIRQLSCLCQQSKEMFEELEQMAGNTFRRSRNLTDRVTVLKEMASRLNPTVDEVSLDDIGAYKPYKSNSSKDPSFSRQRPQGVVVVYLSGKPVPALAKLNQFRDDGKDCVKMYTNPDFFFELWSSQIEKEVKEKKPKRKKRQAQAQVAVTVRAPKNVKQLELISKVQRQNEAPAIKPKPVLSNTTASPKPSTCQQESPQLNPSPSGGQLPPPAAPDICRKPSIVSTSEETPSVPSTPKGGVTHPPIPKPASNRPSIAPPPPPPPPPVDSSASHSGGNSKHGNLPTPPPIPPSLNGKALSSPDDQDDTMDAMPPPPPPILRNVEKKSTQRGTLYSVSDFKRETAFFPPPPPPMISEMPESDFSPAAVPPTPPPPPPAPPAAPPPPAGPILPTPESAFQLRSVAPQTQKRESRSDLLCAIRSGITLRKVEETEKADEVKQPTGGLFDVQTILEMRRKALEEDSDDDDDDGDGWED